MKTLITFFLFSSVSVLHAQGNDTIVVELIKDKTYKGYKLTDLGKHFLLNRTKKSDKYLYTDNIVSINGRNVSEYRFERLDNYTKPKSKEQNVGPTSFRNTMGVAGNLLIAGGCSFTVAFATSLINIKLGSDGLSYISVGSYGLTGFFILGAGINLVRSSKVKQITFKNKTHLNYGIVDSGLGLKYGF